MFVYPYGNRRRKATSNKKIATHMSFLGYWHHQMRQADGENFIHRGLMQVFGLILRLVTQGYLLLI